MEENKNNLSKVNSVQNVNKNNRKRTVKDTKVENNNIKNSNQKLEKKEVINNNLSENAKLIKKSSVRKNVNATNTRNIQKEQKNKKSDNKLEFRFKQEKLKIIPLGGIQEIGKNITVFEYGDDIVLVDCGLAFPEDDMLGIDLVIPDFTYLEKNREKIRGLVITHGHEDHIGAIPYLLSKINVPIYATKLTAGLISHKLEEHKLLKSTKLKIVNQGQTIVLGKIRVEFIRSCHSIPDAVALAIHTPVGTVVHTGDFKIDYTPIDDAERKGYTMSESSVGEVLDKLFFNCTKRIVVATFASNVHRVQQIVNSAVANNRKIAVCGRSMINMIDTAMELGYINVPDHVFIDIDMIKNYPDEQLVIITTGSQGETMSALTRMAAGEHKKVTITPNDLVIISANPIPGNEKYVAKVIDDLMKIGAEVVYSSLEAIHVSGHACQEEQKLMLSLIRPKYFIPVHGEYRQLIAHSDTAKKVGIPPENCCTIWKNNG